MALLGQLTVGILGDLSGYSKTLSAAQKETIKFGKSMESVGRDISTVGYGIQDVGNNLTRKITKPAIVAGTALAGMVSTLGFKRLIGMDNAQAKLKGLGIEGKQLEVVMENAKDAVTGTTHTMADGVDAAAGALAAGVKEGADLERYIKLVGDAATGSNRPMSEMAQIFNRVQGAGKLMGTELDMIEHGMPGFSQAIAKHLGVAPEEMREMVSQGKVSADDFLDVMEGFAGGMSEAFAGTWQGMTKNILSNIGIIGEALLEGLFEDGKKGLASFLEVLRSDGLKDWARETGETIRETANIIVEKVQEMKAKWDELSPTMQDVLKKVALFGSIGAVLIGPVLSVIGGFIVTLGSAITKIGTIIGAITRLGGVFGILTGPIGITIGIIGALIGVGVLLYQNWDTIKEKSIEVFSNFEPLLEVVKNAFQSLLDSTGPIMETLKSLWESLLPIFEAIGVLIGGVVVTAFGILISTFSAVVAAIGPMINAFLSLLDMVVNVVMSVVSLFTGDFSGAMDYWKNATEASINLVKGLWNSVISFFSTFISTIVSFFHGLYMTLVGNSIIPDMVNAIVKWFSNMFKWLVNIVKSIVSGVVSGFNAMRNGISTVMNAIRSVITSVWNGIRSVINSVMNAIRSVVTSIWNGIKSSITSIVNSIKSTITSTFNNIKSTTTSIFNGVKTAMTKPVESAKNTIKRTVDAIKGFFTGMKLKIPKFEMPKMPKFTLKGKFSLKPPSVPKIGVSWNAMGGIFNKPTIFNTANAGLQGVGEAGAEAIIPLKPKVLAGIGEGIQANMKSDGTVSILTEVLHVLQEILIKKSNVEISLDGEVITDKVNEINAINNTLRRF